MVSSFRQYCYYAGWFFKSKFGKKRPLVNTMIIGYNCNLRCKHCSVIAHSDDIEGAHSLPYDTAIQEMKGEFENGARIIFFEGGEPTIWKDGDKAFPDLIAAAKEIGYYVIGYTTNGTGRIYENCDVISVSMDGPREIHDSIRGEGVFDKMMENISNLEHTNIFANLVVMQHNKDHIRETLEIVRDNPNISGLMVNFLTPPPYEIAVSPEERAAIVEDLLKFKKEGLPVLNTENALKELLIEDYSEKCPKFVSVFTIPDGSKFHGCPAEGTDSCKHCGFDAVREYRLILDFNIETVMKMSKQFALTNNNSKRD